jgi:hypothetical protein
VPALGSREAKGKKNLIEDNIARYVDVPGRDIETFDAFVKSTIAKKNTSLGPKSELAFVVWMKIGPVGATKNTKCIIVWCDMVEFFGECRKIENFCGK